MFENRCELNEAMIIETSNSLKLIKVLRWMLIVLLALMAFVMLVVLLGADTMDMETVAPLLLSTVACAAFVCLPKVCAKLEMHKIRKKYGGIVPISITWFDHRIVTNDGDGKRYFEYSQITGVRMFDDYFVIFLDHLTFIPLSYDGFIKGTFAEFKQFLRTKRPDLKIPE